MSAPGQTDSTASTNMSDYSHNGGHSMIYVVMTSTLYTVVCIVVVAVLVSLLMILIYCYCFRVRNSYKYSTDTVRYSSVSLSDQSEDEKLMARKSKRCHARGLGYDAAPCYSPGASKWPTVPVSPYVDISAGHLLLSYIEDNLKNQNKLRKEWESLQEYSPEGTSTFVTNQPDNKPKNRYPDAVPYDHNRVKLGKDSSIDGSDYINASFIVDTDPTHPKYIATQGPLESTITDFWQMVWEQHVAVIVMLTAEADMGLTQSTRYWPPSGVVSYHDYEVRLVSEHRQTADFIVRSLYVTHRKTLESRTITHFQYLTWTSVAAPKTPTALLQFRRKVNMAHQSWQHTPLLVHCSGGVGRTGTYILIDMALSRIQKGAKELNMAATVEHLRDNRAGMVRPKAQFEFALSALVEETHNMLNAGQRH